MAKSSMQDSEKIIIALEINQHSLSYPFQDHGQTL